MFKDYFTKYSFTSFCRDFYGYNVYKDIPFYDDLYESKAREYLEIKWENFKTTQEYKNRCDEQVNMIERLTQDSNYLLASIPKFTGWAGQSTGLPLCFWRNE